jgi:transposase
VQLLREEHQKKADQIRAEDLVFIDESGANLAFTRLYARSKRGKRAFGSVPKNWGENVTILGALSSQGILASMYLPGSCDQSVFLKYLEEVLIPQLWKGAVVVMDNLSVHKSPTVEELLASKGVRVLYLPPYSPDFNPIEKAWSKLKSFLRKEGARTYRTLGRAIAKGLERITSNHALSWFRHCGYHPQSAG